MRLRGQTPTIFGPLAIVLLVTGPIVRADVGPPIGIRMSRNAPQAVAGQEYNGKFLVHGCRVTALLADPEKCGIPNKAV